MAGDCLRVTGFNRSEQALNYDCRRLGQPSFGK
jgi:hypothetical protein